MQVKWILFIAILCISVMVSGCTNTSSSQISATATTPSPEPASTSVVLPPTIVTTTIVTTVLPTTVPVTTKSLQSSATGVKPTVKILETNPAGNQALVNVEFTNPTDEDLSMTAIVQVTYQYGGGISGQQQGRSSASGVAQADVPAGGKMLTTAKIDMAGYGETYVDGMATLSNFQYSKVVKK